jgi:outer membrane murein-binding lipoprotein Lpp
MSLSVTKTAPTLVILIGALGLGGCATKGFVREQVATVSHRVDALEAKLQETDGTAKSALAQAQAASGQAQAASGQAQNNAQRLDQLNARVDGIEQQMQQNRKKRPRN